ncbi:MAG: hypothetical protein NXI21_01385 [Alphaproteobacteria bacterium]|nr:hypothetical protein [Alphaproteobacteria bacterium]
MSAQEVRETFIDREWTQGSGVFLFGSDGRWRYRDPKFRVEGVYELNEEGVICAVNVGGQAPGRRTCYSFFRNGAEYRYFHDRSGKYWPAILK